MQNINCQSCNSSVSNGLYSSKFSQSLIRYALWNSVIFSFLFAYYSTPLRTISYVLLFFNIVLEFAFNIKIHKRTNIKAFGFLSVLVLFLFVYSNLFSTENNLFLTLYFARFYLGFILTYLFFKIVQKAKINSFHLFIFSAIAFIEPVFVFLDYPLIKLPHYVILSNSIGEIQLLNRFVSGDSLRPLGPALNTSVSGTLSVIILFLCLKKIFSEKNKSKKTESFLLYIIILFAFLNSIFYMSTTSYVIFFIYIITKIFRSLYRLSFQKTFFIFLFIGSVSVIFLSILLNPSTLLNNPFFSRAMSLDYIGIVLQMKIQEFRSVFLTNNSFFSTFFGIHQGLPELVGHSQLFSFFRVVGIIPATLLVYLFISKGSPLNRIYILLLFVATFHYQVIFSFPGQIITGALLTNKILILDQKT